jgi:hypothetical protein
MQPTEFRNADDSRAFAALGGTQTPKPQPQPRSRVRVIPQQPEQAKTISWGERLRPKSGTIAHLLFFAGLIAITAGAAMIYQPLGALVGGAIAVAIAMLMGGPEDEPIKTNSK